MNFLNRTGPYSTMTFFFHDGTGRQIKIVMTGRDGKQKLSRGDGTVNKNCLDGTGRYIYSFFRRYGTVHIIFHDGTGRYVISSTTGRDGISFFSKARAVHFSPRDGTVRIFLHCCTGRAQCTTHCSRHQSSSFFFIPFIIFALPFSRPPSRNSDPGSHSKHFSTPTHYGSCLAFFVARRFQLFLPSSTRVELCLPTLGALSS